MTKVQPLTSSGNSLGTEKISKLFTKMAIPAVLSQLITLAYNVTDRIFVGHIPVHGDLALTGLGVCLPVTVILSAFAQLVCFGGAPRISHFLGEHDTVSAEKTIGTCTLCAVCIGAVLTAVSLLFENPILRLFGASSQTIGYAKSYFHIYVLGTIFVELANGLVFFISAQGYATAAMISVLIGAVLNIGLDPVLIFSLHTGVRGAAIATVFSQGVSCVYTVAFLVKKGIVRLHWKYLRFDKSMLFPALFLGLSPFVQVITESLTSACFNYSLLKYGGDLAVGSMTIYATVMQFNTLPLTGLANGAQPIISYNLGAEKKDRVRACCHMVLRTGLIYSTSMWLFIQIFPSCFPSIFAQTGALRSYSISHIRVFFSMLWVMGLQVCCQLMFVALGNAKTSLFLALLRKVILLTSLIFLLPHILPNPVTAVFLAEPIADTLACATTVTFFRKSFAKIK